MKISLKWLSQYIDIAEEKKKPEGLANLLTNKGLEVESVENKSKTYENVVVGHILEKNQHPDADRLSVCQVSTGGGVVHQIVCGAKNHKAGDRVVVSLPGAVLPGDFQIKKSKIRGVESSGMLCSEVELGLAKESEGILILPADAPIGVPFAEYKGLDDVTMELKVTPNRADCLSHYGLARELGTLLNREYSLPIGTLTTGGDTRSRVRLDTSEAGEGCPRYAGRAVIGVKVGPSPDWLKRSVEAVGLNSINNVVDVTNYVMMELGQPLHAFDIKNIKGGLIKVGKATKGEVFTSLDGTKFTLDGTELMIRDAERAIAMAGVVGGQNSGVDESTTELFVECAYFTPSVVRKQARRHGIQTDSAYRFSRGVDPEGVLLALNRCCELIQKVAGGETLGQHYDDYPRPIQTQEIFVDLDRVSQRLGAPVEASEFKGWMERLGCRVREQDGFRILPPTFRQDLEIAEDLMEEFARLKGYDWIPEVVPAVAGSPSPHSSAYVLSRVVSRKLVAEGFQQANNFAFTSSKWEDSVLGDRTRGAAWGIDYSHQPITIRNPLSEELNVMRTSLVPGLIQNVSHNQRHGNEVGRLFEIGQSFERSEEVITEDWRLGLIFWGQNTDLWEKTRAPLVLEAKSAIENLLKGLGGRNWSWEQKDQVPEFLHPGQAAGLFYEGKSIGYLGALHPGLLDRQKIRGPVVVAEFDLSLLLSGQPRVVKTKRFSRFPSVERDLALLMPQRLPAADVMAVMKKAGGQQLQSVRVFDVFEGESLPAGQRSVAFRLVYQDLEGTLTDEVVQSLQEKVLGELQSRLGLSVRQ